MTPIIPVDPHAGNAVEAMHRAVELARRLPETARNPDLCALAAVRLAGRALLPPSCAPQLDSAAADALHTGDMHADMITAAALLLLAAAAVS